MRKILSVILALALCISMSVPAIAANETNTLGVTFSAELDSATLQMSENEQTVVLTVTASSAVSTSSISYTATCNSALTLKALEGDGVNVTEATTNLGTGKFSWSASGGSATSVTTIAKVTVTVPANTNAGTYEIGVSDIKLSADYGMTIIENGATATATLTIQAAESEEPATKTLQSIAVTTQPTKTEYTVGDTFDATGMVVTAYYTDETNEAVTGYTVSSVDMTSAGTKTVTVSYTEGEVTETATFEITVNAAPKTLTGITVTTPPAKTEYTEGDTFDATDMVVTATYSDGSTAVVTDYTVSPETLSAAGDEVEVTITYQEKTATVTVKVVEPAKVAAIGEVEYTTLAEAITAAEAGSTVKLLADVVLTEQILVAKEITLDLNGKTISNTTDIWNATNRTYGLICVAEGGNLTLVDSVGTGKIQAKANDCYAVWLDGGNCTIQSGKYVGNISAVYVLKGALAINGGTFSIQQTYQGSYVFTLNCYDANYTDGTATITVSGGEFYCYDPANSTSENPTASLVSDGYEATYDETTRTYTVAKAVVKYTWYENGKTSGSYSIGTAEELRQFAAIVNGTDENYDQDDFSGKTVTLTADIALAEDGLYSKVENVIFGASGMHVTTTHYYVTCTDEELWTPIGIGTSSTSYNDVTVKSAFAGTFDGSNKTISGLYTGNGTATKGNTVGVQGLFGVVTGTVKNVTVSGCVTGRSVVGGVVAYLNGGTIENCTNKAIVFSDGGTTPSGKKEDGGFKAGATGGIVGRAGGTASVTKCLNTAHVVCANSAQGGRVAGIIGLIDAKTDEITINQNGNKGVIEGYQYVAGIVGMNASTKSPVDRCYNTGDISGWGFQKTHVGGISGQYNSAVTNCYNTGNVTMKHVTSNRCYSGGVASDHGDNANPEITNCYNIGVVYSDTGINSTLGTITGAGTASNCYYLDTSVGNAELKNGTSKTDGEMKETDFLTAINVGNMNAFVADDAENPINNGFPVLRWQRNIAELTPTSTTCEGKFVTEYNENAKFNIDTFKIYTVYEDPDQEDCKVQLTEYKVYVDGNAIDPSSYQFALADNGKTIKVEWAPVGEETCSVEKTLTITVDYPVSYKSFSGTNPTAKAYYFVGDPFDMTGITDVTYNMASGTTKTVENGEGTALVFTITGTGDTVLDTSGEITAAYKGATLTVTYTENGETVSKDLGTFNVLLAPEAVNGVYQLKTVDDVQWFTAKVNSGATDVDAILLADLDLAGTTLYTVNDYAGTFDGNGKTLNIKAALFNSVSTGTVKNLTVTGSISGSTKGGIVNTINGAATIENCVNKATISCGDFRGGTVGGIVGAITADAEDAKITKCVNEGTISITASYATNAGGIVAKVDCADVEISQCVNIGAVKVSATFGTTAGGIAAVSKAKITDCYNTAAVSASGFRGTNAGGIVGNNSGTITNCYSIGTASSQTAPSGAIAASNSGTITNSYALTGANANLVGTNSGTIDETSAFLSSAELKVAPLGDAWTLHSNTAVNSGYPVLTWQNLISDYVISITDGIDGTAQVCRGAEVTMDVVVTGTKAFNGAEVIVTYDKTALTYVSGATQELEDGKVKITVHSDTALESGSTIATLTFKVNEGDVAAGTYELGFASAVAQDYEEARMDDVQADVSTDSIEIVESIAGVNVSVKADYVNGYTLVVAEKTDSNTRDEHYSYDGNDMVYVAAYDAYVWLIEGGITVEEAAAKVAVSTSDSYVTIAVGNDVNGSGKVDFSDATAAFGCANVKDNQPYSTVDDLLYFVRADVNGDYQVTAADVAAILSSY